MTFYSQGTVSLTAIKPSCALHIISHLTFDAGIKSDSVPERKLWGCKRTHHWMSPYQSDHEATCWLTIGGFPLRSALKFLTGIIDKHVCRASMYIDYGISRTKGDEMMLSWNYEAMVQQGGGISFTEPYSLWITLVSCVECAVCAVFAPSHCVMFYRVLICSIVYCLCLPLSLLGCPVGRCRDRGCYVH